MALIDSIAVDLTGRLEDAGESLPMAGSIAPVDFTVGEKDLKLPEGASYDVVFTNTGDGILLTGLVRGRVTGTCDRCLEPAEFEISGEIEEYYLFAEPEDPESFEDGYELVGEDRVVDLAGPLSDAIVMDTPFVVLCEPDCKGLCPTCGCNLNVEQCSCTSEAELDWVDDPRNPFAALKDLKLDENA